MNKENENGREKGCRFYARRGCLVLSVLMLLVLVRCYVRGPYIGRVVDAETGKPIKGAVVKLEVDYKFPFPHTMPVEAMGFAKTGGFGFYFVWPVVKVGFAVAQMRELNIYKAGYIAYSSWGGRYFRPEGRKHKFRWIFNKVKLEKWDDKKYAMQDHVYHVGFIGCDLGVYSGGKKLKKFCAEAREEMIYRCQYHNPDYTRSYSRCAFLVDKTLGLLSESEGEK